MTRTFTRTHRLPPRILAWSDNETVPRAVNFAVRVTLVVVVGVVMSLAPWPGGGYVAVEIAALVVTAGVLSGWVSTDWRRAAPAHAALRPYALMAMAVSCGAASATPTGRIFNVPSFLAVVAAGSDLGLGIGLTVTGLGIAATLVTGLASGADAIVTTAYSGTQVLAFVLGRNLQANRVHAEQADRLREEQARTATLDERNRIAREIHDVLAHSLGALGLQIQLARAVLTDQHDEARAVDVLAQAQRMANDGLNETRRAIHALRGETLPLADGLAALGASHQRHHGTQVTFEVSGDVRPLPADAQLAITRTAQEALVNSAKHAPRQPVEMHLEYADTGTSLTVRNRLGAGGHAHQPQLATANGRYGLAGMHERLLLLHGTLSAGPSSGEWVVVARVPR
jgi:signal transduction histidine kinase